MIQLSSPCFDCAYNTTPCHRNGKPVRGKWEWYMVKDEIWAQAGMENYGGYLCIGCLEQRLGRQLCTDDFAWNVPINLRLSPRLESPRLGLRKWSATQRGIEQWSGDGARS